MTNDRRKKDRGQLSAEAQVDAYRHTGGPFVVAAETTRMPMIFVRADDDERSIVFANDSFLSLTGFSRAHVLGEPFSILFATDGTAQELVSAASTGGHSELQKLCVRADGSSFTAAILMSEVVDDQGRTKQYFASFVDLDTHIDVLKTAQTRTNILYQNAPGFIAISRGQDHRFAFANKAYIELVGDRRLDGRTVAAAIPEIVDQGLLLILDHVFETGQPHTGRNVPIRLKRKAGGELETRYVDFIYQPMRGSKGQIIGLFCEGHDVTDQTETNEELALAQSQLIHLARVSAMGTMATTLAHELNQPLAIIANYVAGCRRLLSTENEETEKIAQGLTAIGDASVRAGHIIRRLRDMTMRAAPQLEHFDICDAQQEAVQLVRSGGCYNARVVETGCLGAQVFADRIQVQQVIVNLVKNACEAKREGSDHEVRISTTISGDAVTLSVSDNGTGVSADAVEQLFGWSDSVKPGGMGIGLSISRTIIDNQGGRIWLDKTSEFGSRFCFSLPLAKLER